jgi:hypothetical protein
VEDRLSSSVGGVCVLFVYDSFNIWYSILVDVAGFGQGEARETWQLLDLLPPNLYAELLAALLD